MNKNTHTDIYAQKRVCTNTCTSVHMQKYIVKAFVQMYVLRWKRLVPYTMAATQNNRTRRIQQEP